MGSPEGSCISPTVSSLKKCDDTPPTEGATLHPVRIPVQHRTGKMNAAAGIADGWTVRYPLEPCSAPTACDAVKSCWLAPRARRRSSASREDEEALHVLGREAPRLAEDAQDRPLLLAESTVGAAHLGAAAEGQFALRWMLDGRRRFPHAGLQPSLRQLLFDEAIHVGGLTRLPQQRFVRGELVDGQRLASLELPVRPRGQEHQLEDAVGRFHARILSHAGTEREIRETPMMVIPVQYQVTPRSAPAPARRSGRSARRSSGPRVRRPWPAPPPAPATDSDSPRSRRCVLRA